MKQIKQIFVEYESPTFITFFNFVLTLFKRSVKIYESRFKNHASKEIWFYKEKYHLQKKFIRFIYKEKYGTVRKLKLVKKKHNQKFKKHM